MQAGNFSRIVDLYAQVYLTGFGWSRAHEMKKKGCGHDTLSLFFKRNFVPPNMVMDVLK